MSSQTFKYPKKGATMAPPPPPPPGSSHPTGGVGASQQVPPYPAGSYMSGTEPGQILKVLADLDDGLTVVNKGITEELVKKKGGFKGILPANPKTAKLLTGLAHDMQWVITRSLAEPLTEGIEGIKICAAYQPITDKTMILAQTLRSAGLEQDGYTTFSQKDREEVAKAIYVLRVSVKAMVNILLEQPLKQKRLSNADQAERLYQQGQHTGSQLKFAEKAWSTKEE